jgi:pyruvate formate lyase activating enzyme
MAPIAGRPGSSQTIGKAVTVTEVLSEIEKDILFYDESCGGVTFSGGEPLLQATFLSALLDACREMNIHTTLDTTGYAPMDILHKVVVKSDLVFYDLKIMQDERHIKYTGVSNEPVLRNLTHIANNGTPIHIRIPLIPAITDDADNIQKMCEFLQPLATVRQVDLLPYHRIAESKYRRLGRPYRMKRVPPLADERVEHIKRKFEANGFCVTIGG